MDERLYSTFPRAGSGRFSFPLSFSFPRSSFGVVIVSLAQSQDSHREPVEDGYINVAMLYDHWRWDGEIREVAAASAVCAVRQVPRKFGDRGMYVGDALRQFVRILHVFRDPVELFLQER